MPNGTVPPERPNVTTITTLWIFTFLTLALLLYRLFWRYRRGDKFLRDDVWIGIAIIPLLLRLAFIYVSAVLLTANFNHKKWPQSSMEAEEVRRRTLGAQMILPGRVMYCAFVWCMKICILHWFEKVTGRTGNYGHMIDSAYYTVWITFAAVCLSTFLECRPIQVYWQIWPDPGHCVKGTVQLVTMGGLNIFTDVILMAIPIPLVFAARMPVIRKLQLLLLFCVSIFVIAVTVIRMPIIIGNNSLQQARTLWASIECFAAALVANAPMFNSILHGFRRPTPGVSLHTPPTRQQGRRTAAMPVTGQDSAGSLTRNDGLMSLSVAEKGQADPPARQKHTYRPSGDKDGRSRCASPPWSSSGAGGAWMEGTSSWSPVTNTPQSPRQVRLKEIRFDVYSTAGMGRV